MTWILTLLIIWCVALFIYGVAVTVVMGKENYELDCKSATYSVFLKTYLCEGIDKQKHDYCSDFKSRYDNG